MALKEQLIEYYSKPQAIELGLVGAAAMFLNKSLSEDIEDVIKNMAEQLDISVLEIYMLLNFPNLPRSVNSVYLANSERIFGTEAKNDLGEFFRLISLYDSHDFELLDLEINTLPKEDQYLLEDSYYNPNKTMASDSVSRYLNNILYKTKKGNQSKVISDGVIGAIFEGVKNFTLKRTDSNSQLGPKNINNIAKFISGAAYQLILHNSHHPYLNKLHRPGKNSLMNISFLRA